MYFHFIVYSLLVFLFSSCAESNFVEDRKGIKKEFLANLVLSRVAARIKNEMGLRPIGDMGQMLHDIEKLGLSFFYYKPIDIAQGRKLLVQSVNVLLDAVNQEKQIHPYLCWYPFQPKNVEISIFIFNPDKSDVLEGTLSLIEADDGILRYKIHCLQKGFITVYEETFDEALERLKDPSLPPVPFKPRTKKVTREEWHRVRKGVSFVAGDGTLWYPDESGAWVQSSQEDKKD